jgi:hypothetical protein
MDLLQRMGGRKFILALLAIGVATAIEIKTERGLSATMAGFLGTLVAAFSVVNYAVTKKHMESKVGGPDIGELGEKIDRLSEMAATASDAQAVQQLIGLLQTINSGVSEVKGAQAEMGKSMVNVARVVAQKG